MMAKGKRSELDKWLTSAEAAERMGRTERWLRNQRRLKQGPPYTRYQGWQPLYRAKDVDAWVKAQLAARYPKPLKLVR